jgi:hypothetical protein
MSDKVDNISEWGGARMGSGQKPQKSVPPVDEAALALAEPPDGLRNEYRAFWQAYAPLAIEKRTLTRHTVPSFGLLCEVEHQKRLTLETIEAQGRTFIKVTVDGAGVEHQELKAHPLTGAYGRLAKAAEALMARFGLAPFGKPEQPIGKSKPAAANPWAQVAAK